MERTPTCCALRRRSSARWADASLVVLLWQTETVRARSAKLTITTAEQSPDRNVEKALDQKWAHQEQGEFKDPGPRYPEEPTKNNGRLRNPSTLTATGLGYLDLRTVACARISPGLGPVAEERSP